MPNTVKHNGMSGMVTQLFTQHSAQCPLRGGYAVSLTNWANTPLPAGPVASWHSFVDPIARVRMVPWHLAAWVQGYANPFAFGVEAAGYAEFSEEEWLTPEGLKQLENLAHEWVYYWEIEKSQGNAIPLRWLETWEVEAVMAGNRDIKGFCTHGQIEPASRWDPGPNFPYTRLMDRIKQILAPGETPPPVLKPKPKPEPKEWYEMAIPKEDLRSIHDAIWHGTPGAKLIQNRLDKKGEWAETALGSLTDRIVRQQLAPMRQQAASQDAQINSLVGAIAALSKGESFDEAKLLAGVKASAAAGVKEAVDSIEKTETTTVTIKEG
ncbi:N-acetylmuramoyl-L-alanine amidase [Arthrobacter sp. Hz1]